MGESVKAWLARTGGRGIKRSGYHVINDFIGIFPLIVFKLGQQVFVDVIQKNFTYFADLTFLWVD